MKNFIQQIQPYYPIIIESVKNGTAALQRIQGMDRAKLSVSTQKAYIQNQIASELEARLSSAQIPCSKRDGVRYFSMGDFIFKVKGMPKTYLSRNYRTKSVERYRNGDLFPLSTHLELGWLLDETLTFVEEIVFVLRNRDRIEEKETIFALDYGQINFDFAQVAETNKTIHALGNLKPKISAIGELNGTSSS